MFDNSGEKLRILAKVEFALTVVLAVIVVIASLISAGDRGILAALVGLVSAAVYVLCGWLAAIYLCAIADAAGYAEITAANTDRILKAIKSMKAEGNEDQVVEEIPRVAEEEIPRVTETVPQKFDAERIPAWKRVQMEQENKQ